MKRKISGSNLKSYIQPDRKGVGGAMSVFRKLTGSLVLLTAFTFAGSALLNGCGNLVSQDVPGAGEKSLSVKVLSQVGEDSDGNPMVRANGRDTFEFIATVKGLEGNVGFFLPTAWGAFQGGTLSATDGYTYFNADEDGKARALYVASTVMGRIELRSKSQYKTVMQTLTFDFGTLTLYPSAATIYALSGEKVRITARGAKPPVRWETSHPSFIDITVIDDLTAEFEIKSDSRFEGTTDVTVTISAWDQEATAPATSTLTIDMGTAFDSSSCSAGAITVSPTTGATGGTWVSVVVVDPDKAGSSSVTVQVSGLSGASTLTLTEFGTPGIFQVSFSASGTGITSFSYSDIGEGCNLALISASWTGS